MSKQLPLELWKDGDYVKWFPTQADAAAWLGVKQHTLSTDIAKGHRCKGYELRKSTTLDETFESIKNQTYQFTRL